MKKEEFLRLFFDGNIVIEIEDIYDLDYLRKYFKLKGQGFYIECTNDGKPMFTDKALFSDREIVNSDILVKLLKES